MIALQVPLEQNAEPGWLAGELRGATGWFPESYVELIDTATADGQMTAAETEAMQKRHLEGIAEVPENISDNGSAVLEVAASSGGDAGGAQGPAVGEMPSLVLGLGTAVELTVVALYNFAPSDPRQLAFAKGDQFEVTENQDKWWYGSVNGAEGWFPKNYVKLATEPVAAVQATIPAASDGAIPEDQQEYYVSLYPYQSEEAGDLSFKQGEVMVVVKMEGIGGGVIGDRTGIFPSNYCSEGRPTGAA
ncbi:intersectin-1-like, partial [Nilaparvata lugens]|uniref:intersectin-1-like n=1 Tax=Nilaparvata lugens TaxID=108931 RepID=UPI00193DF53B